MPEEAATSKSGMAKTDDAAWERIPRTMAAVKLTKAAAADLREMLPTIHGMLGLYELSVEKLEKELKDKTGGDRESMRVSVILQATELHTKTVEFMASIHPLLVGLFLEDKAVSACMFSDLDKSNFADPAGDDPVKYFHDRLDVVLQKLGFDSPSAEAPDKSGASEEDPSAMGFEKISLEDTGKSG